MNSNYWKKGSWNVLCDACGKKYKADMLQKQWNELMVCSNCFEIRHPIDFLKAPPNSDPVPWTRPEATDTFVTLNSYTPYVNWVNIYNEGIPNWEVPEEV